MKTHRNKKIIAAITMIVLMTSITVLAIPVQAQDDIMHGGMPSGTGSGISGALPAGATPSVTVDTSAWLSFSPNPIGVGQSLLVNMWTTSPVSPMRFHQGYKVTITKPDGSTEVVGPMNSYQADATAWFQYVPAQVGTYKLKFEFPGEYYPAGNWYNGYLVPATNTSGYALDSAYYQPCSTAEQTLVVQTEQVYSWPPSPLPTDYWTRPVHLENREWWPILGNFPAFGIVGGGPNWLPDTNTYVAGYNFVPYVQAPNTGHVVWKQQEADAGIIGGAAGQYNAGGFGGVAVPSVIYNGRCYATQTVPVDGVPTSCAVCYDLRTGQQYYAIPISQGGVTPQAISYARGTAAAVPGAAADQSYSVTLLAFTSSRLYKINPWTGAVTLNVTGMSPQLIGGVQGGSSTGGFYADPNVLTIQSVSGKNFLIKWTTAGSSTNFTSRILKNISIPFTLPTYPSGILGYAGYAFDFENDIAVWMVGLAPAGVGVYYGTYMQAISMDTGQLLWNRTYTETRYSSSCFVADHGLVAVLMEKGFYEAFDIHTGNPVWKSEIMSYPWGSDSFGAYAYQSAYGLLYRESYDGIYAFNWTNGKIAWFYELPAVAFETPYTDANGSGTYPFNQGGIIADGKLYVSNTEHTPTYPRTRGWKLNCVNATTGAGIWTMMGSQNIAGMADGYLVAGNPDDGYLYVYGKGKSATTVTAPDTAVPLGTALTIKGSVLDQSPAQPNTPCVSAASMTTQMQYLHFQIAQNGVFGNETLTGVPISLTAIDSNGSVTDLGIVTTNGYYGTFSKAWTPPKEDTFTIVASFLGDDSYGSSSAATAVTVGPAPSTTHIPEGTPATDITPIYYGIAAAVIIIVLAIAIALVLLLRKR
ncbi:MAG TPA: PQQ-binding-like beta-propeller repeat protein [Candidatus Sulfotelmatobacter sp.]|nr:PQQ-binding-like beta-propeller repeat protein [Candidatus Sulfotelmatobacter sp.]